MTDIQGKAGTVRYRKKPVVIDATQWWKNGDHPDDDSHPIGEIGSGELSEGRIVRRFRSSDIPGEQECSKCGTPMHRARGAPVSRIYSRRRTNP